MRVLVAEDDPIYRRVLESTLTGWGYEVALAEDGAAALQSLEAETAPPLALLDWMMPGLTGPEVCRQVRARQRPAPAYLILLTARELLDDLVEGLESGANDYVTKPFEPAELRARIRVGCQVVELQQALLSRVRELENALGQVRQLQGLLPICCYCKKIRDDSNYWQQVDAYITQHTELRFSHGICPDCWNHHVTPQLAQMHNRTRGDGNA